MANPVYLTRRGFAAAAMCLFAMPAFAVSAGDAETLVKRAVGDVQAAIDSGKTEAALYRDFKRIFENYADVPLVAAGSLGVTWRSASNSQKRKYISVFSTYLSEKYGRRFDEFSGAEFSFVSTSETKRGYSVKTHVALPSGSSIVLEWQVRDVKGSPLIFDIVIEGISMLVTERTEIGAMLDARGGDLDKLIADMG